MFEKLQKLLRSSEPSETDLPEEHVEEELPEDFKEEVLPAGFSEITNLPITRQGNIVRFDTDGLTVEERIAFAEALAKETGHSFVVRKIESAYSIRSVTSLETCPRCQSPTEIHSANVIYATQIAPRVMAMGGVYFCTSCPTVIVDENVIQRGMSPEFEYRGLLGLDFDGKAEPCFFRYWNEQEMIILVDQETGFMELVPKSELKLSKPAIGKGLTRQVSKKKSSRSAMAKKSRKQNRKKK